MVDVRADLHLHSLRSDGAWAPRKVVRAARHAGLSAMALTDHDNVDGVAEAIAAGEDEGVLVIPGVEISTWWDTDLHLLAYGFRPGPSPLHELLDRSRDARRGRAERILERLADEGMPVTIDAVLHQAGGAAIGRPHIAQALHEAGHVGSYREAFDRWIGEGQPACVDKLRVDPHEAMELVRAAGGVTVLAHPGIYGGPEFVEPLIEMGLDGIEVRHPLHGRKSELAFDELARSNGLLRTGGSDFHRPGGHIEVGTVTIPADWLEALLERTGTPRGRLAAPGS